MERRQRARRADARGHRRARGGRDHPRADGTAHRDAEGDRERRRGDPAGGRLERDHRRRRAPAPGLHPKVAAAASPPPAKLVSWLLDFQLDGRQDFFEVDIVDYAPALGPAGLERYRAALAEREAALGTAPAGEHRWSSPDSHTRFVLEYNVKRLAVLDRHVDAIIRTHARDRGVAAWLHDTAKALEEIGEVDLAID
ncbi:MAG: hypothetical protein M3O32_03495 [Actinomycetota bacterium]|nr:hypothetical protein [Actinomycetota bacterium]